MKKPVELKQAQHAYNEAVGDMMDGLMHGEKSPQRKENVEKAAYDLAAVRWILGLNNQNVRVQLAQKSVTAS